MLTILCGDALEQLRQLPDESVQCCVTSPPYWGLRDYGHAGQLGLEKTPEEYVASMVAVFREVQRVLKGDGIFWLNLGDSYAGSGKGPSNAGSLVSGPGTRNSSQFDSGQAPTEWIPVPRGLKPKDLVGIPWMMAFALRDAGWYFRSAAPWVKRNPMPESTSDRPASAIEYMFMFSKSQRYFYDEDAVKVRAKQCTIERGEYGWSGITGDEKGALTVGARNGSRFHDMREKGITMKEAGLCTETRSRRNSDPFFESWQGMYEESGEVIAFIVNTNPYKEAHFATFPPKLVHPCIISGSRPGDVILDPFAGSGTTGMVALELGRKAVLIELNPDYVKLIDQRCHVTPGLALA